MSLNCGGESQLCVCVYQEDTHQTVLAVRKPDPCDVFRCSCCALVGLKWMQTWIIDNENYQYFKLKFHAAINYFFNSELEQCAVFWGTGKEYAVLLI